MAALILASINRRQMRSSCGRQSLRGFRRQWQFSDRERCAWRAPVYLDLCPSCRADAARRHATTDRARFESRRYGRFRVVRTGRISGVVWLDLNENGRLDETEQPLPDVRVVTGSGRDTLTDEKGYFIIGDLPPGEHIVLFDEKTIPEQTRSIPLHKPSKSPPATKLRPPSPSLPYQTRSRSFRNTSRKLPVSRSSGSYPPGPI